jgi:hypothetical protein
MTLLNQLGQQNLPVGNKVTLAVKSLVRRLYRGGRCERLISRASGSGELLERRGRTYRFQPYNFIRGEAAVQCFSYKILDKQRNVQIPGFGPMHVVSELWLILVAMLCTFLAECAQFVAPQQLAMIRFH